jgi:hypothetical protein
MALAFTACQKRRNLSSVKNQGNNIIIKPISILNGRMVFKDTATFYQHLRWIYKNQGKPALITQFNKNNGFESMMAIYNYGMKLDNKSDFEAYLKRYPNSFYAIKIDSSVFYELPASIGLAYLSNKNGIFQVGNDICRITFDNFLEIRNGNTSKISSLLLPLNQISDKDIKISSTHGTLKYAHQYSYRTAYFSNKKRIVARLYTELIDGGLGTFTEYSARTTSQKKSLGWWQRRISDVGVGWDQGYCKDLLGNTYNIPAYYDHKTDKADIKRVVFQATFTVDNSHSTCLAKHYGKDGSIEKWITNNEIFQ